MNRLSEASRALINSALMVLEDHIKYNDIQFTSCSMSHEYFRLRLGGRETERFDVAFLDNQNRLIECETIATGTIDKCTVFPREIVKRALELNANAIMLAHNHPSNECTPSAADRNITKRIVDACKLLDIIVLDHIIATNDDTYSFAEHGEI